eukprot:gene6139-7648_t
MNSNNNINNNETETSNSNQSKSISIKVTNTEDIDDINSNNNKSQFIKSKLKLSTSPSGGTVQIGGTRSRNNQLENNNNNNNNNTSTGVDTSNNNSFLEFNKISGIREINRPLKINNSGKQEESQNQHIITVQWRDNYGFIVEDFVPELKKFEQLELEQTQLKIDNWTIFNEQYGHRGLCSNPKRLHKLLSQGIPHQTRISLWKIYSGSFEKQRKEEIELFKQQKEEKQRARGIGTIRGLTPPSTRKSYYQHLHSIIRTANRLSTRFQSLPEIDKDISRTFPGHPFFDSEEGKRKLTRVLQAYSFRNRKVGYCQSMNIVAGMLLYVMNKDEEEAFWMLSTIVEDYCQNYYSTNLLGSQVDMIVFDKLVQQHIPNVHQHLQNYCVSLPLLSTKWFMCLFIGVLPTEITLRIWDHLFVECGIYGYNKPNEESQWLEDKPKDYKCLGLASYNLLLTAMSILLYLEDSLLACNSTPHLLTILSSHVRAIYDSKSFFKKYYQLREKISEESFIELKQKHEVSFVDDLEEMRRQRDLNQTLKITRFSKTDLEKIWTGFRKLEISNRYSMGKSLLLDFGMFKNVFNYILPQYDGSSTSLSSNTTGNPKELVIKQLFKAFDKNKDGTLDFTELMSGLCILAKGTSEERLKLYFSFFDTNNTGYVTKEEMKLMLQHVYDKIEMDPLAVTQYTIEDYVDIVFSNLGIQDDHLSFEMFRQAIQCYPRIFRCFMIEEETFNMEDYYDLDPSSNDLEGSGAGDRNSISRMKKKSVSRSKFQEVLMEVDQQQKQQDSVNTTILETKKESVEEPESKSASKLNFSEKPKMMAQQQLH